MKKHKLTYEQYCCVLRQNIVLEETVYHNGTHEVSCTHFAECKNDGGCRNAILNARIKKNIPNDN